MKLHLGVIDQPYVDGGGQTTGEVAEILEGKYHVMQIFSEMHELDISEALTKSMAGALENAMMGAPTIEDPFIEGTSQIESMFKQFLTNKELDGAVDGVPTAAAVNGRSKRFKNKKGPSRPSFIDTGLYQASFKSWVDGIGGLDNA